MSYLNIIPPGHVVQLDYDVLLLNSPISQSEYADKPVLEQ